MPIQSQVLLHVCCPLDTIRHFAAYIHIYISTWPTSSARVPLFYAPSSTRAVPPGVTNLLSTPKTTTHFPSLLFFSSASCSPSTHLGHLELLNGMPKLCNAGFW